MDVLHHGLQPVKVLDFVHAVAGLLYQVGVDDDAVALIAVADGDQLAGFVIKVVSVRVQLVGNGGAGEIQRVVRPVLYTGLVADNEHGGGIGFVHLGVELLVIGARSGGHDLHVHAGLFLVQLRHVLEHFIRFGLEVQPVDRTAGGRRGSSLIAGAAALVVAAAAGQQGQAHYRSQHQSQNFSFHSVSSCFHPYVTNSETLSVTFPAMGLL